jgi:flagellar basal body-associated protein FliL
MMVMSKQKNQLMKVIPMLVVLLLTLLAASVLAPWLGVDTGDGRSESARPAQGWFPALSK